MSVAAHLLSYWHLLCFASENINHYFVSLVLHKYVLSHAVCRQQTCMAVKLYSASVGMALGTGSALAHRAVDSVLGSRNPEPAQAQQAAEQIAREPDTPCNRQAKTFADCMSDNNGDLESCRYYFDNLQTCRQQLQ